MPWVGGHCQRWEARARVCAGIHGNHVLIGQWSGRMIVSCCQWGLFMKTCCRFGQSQMGPSSLRGRRERIYALIFQSEPFQSISWEPDGSCWCHFAALGVRFSGVHFSVFIHVVWESELKNGISLQLAPPKVAKFCSNNISSLTDSGKKMACYCLGAVEHTVTGGQRSEDGWGNYILTRHYSFPHIYCSLTPTQGTIAPWIG